MNIQPLDRMAALIVGGTSGIGLEIAAQLAEAGVPRIAINGRTPAKGEAAAARIRERAPDCEVRFLAADATGRAAIEGVVAETAAAFGRIDVLVTAITSTVMPDLFHRLDPADFEALMGRHMGSVLYSNHAVLGHMRAQEGGVIINLSSDAAKLPTPGETVHGALMAAILMFSKTLAVEAARSGIRVHALTPSIVRGTELYDSLMASEFSAKLFAKAESRAWLGVPTPADVAPVAVFLCRPEAARMTGQGISVNGGISVAY
jgi:NAD(P)-dependent dehydrogenase (short-subunit alcohol dehydrogenase family)